MSLWLVIGAMVALALGLVIQPLLRPNAPAGTRREHDLRVYREQLAELERERERGLLDERTAAGARLEIQRRILAADGGGAEVPAPSSARPRRATALGLLILLPLLSGIIYWQLGSPYQPAAPFAGRAAERQRAAEASGPGDARASSIQSLIPRLEAHLEAHPDDLEGWLRLGQSYALTQDFEGAAKAYRRALAIDPKVAEAHSALGEALVMAGGGIVTEPAKQAFSRALELEPADARARFYTGLALAQQGARREALDAWTALIRDSPADAPWLAELRQRVTALAKDLGLDPAAVLPRAVAKTPGSPAPPSDPEHLREAALRLEKQLAADPKDFEGWIRLARSWQALGESARAKQALEHGLDAYPGAPFVRQQLQSAAAELGIDLAGAGPGSAPSAEQMQAAKSMSPEERTTMIRGMVGSLAERLEKQPDDADGWRMLGRSYQVLGEPQKSAAAYARLASLKPQDLDAQIEYARALVALDGDRAAASPKVVEQMRRILALDEDNPEALFYLGEAAAQEGDVKSAAHYWRRLLTRLPADSPHRDDIQKLIDGLGDGG